MPYQNDLNHFVNLYQIVSHVVYQIADTTANACDVINIVEDDDVEVYVLKFDQRKFFDRVYHDYLIRDLECCGFECKLIN